jgi:hypothetical protein
VLIIAHRTRFTTRRSRIGDRFARPHPLLITPKKRSPLVLPTARNNLVESSNGAARAIGGGSPAGRYARHDAHRARPRRRHAARQPPADAHEHDGQPAPRKHDAPAAPASVPGRPSRRSHGARAHGLPRHRAPAPGAELGAGAVPTRPRHRQDDHEPLPPRPVIARRGDPPRRCASHRPRTHRRPNITTTHEAHRPATKESGSGPHHLHSATSNRAGSAGTGTVA